MRPKQGTEPRQKTYATSNRTTKLHSTRPRKKGYSRLRQQKSRRKESLWRILELVCIWSASDTVNSAELETMRTSRSLTTAMTANGVVQIREEATVYVNQLDLLVTVMLPEETPAVLSLGKLCEDRGYTYHWTSGEKPHLTNNGKRINCDIANFVPFVVLSLSTRSFTTPTPHHHLHHRIPYLTSTDTPKIQHKKEVKL